MEEDFITRYTMNETISVAEVLAQMRLPFDSAKAVITQFLREEDGEPYGAWKIETENAAYVLKEAKEYEAESYRTF